MIRKLYTFFLFVFALSGTLDSFAQSGKVLSVDGINSYMSVATHSDLDVAPGQTKTITCWIKTTTTAQTRIIAKRANSNTLNPSTPGTTGTGYELWLGAGGNAGKIAGNAVAWNTASSSSQTFSTTGYNPVASNDGTWHHLAIVFDNSSTNKTVTFYMDGINPNLRAGAFSGTYDFSTGVNLVIGAACNATGFFNGLIDNIRVWNKAMTPTELAADMIEVVTGPTAGLLAGWDFEGTSGTNVPDISGNNHPGTLFGNASIITATPNMTYLSTSLTQTELPVGKGDLDQRIIAFNIRTNGSQNPISLTSFNFTMNGTTAIGDVTKIKIYYTGASNKFNTGSLYGTMNPQTGVITATGTQQLSEGDNYFWIAYDVAANAPESNLLDATCESVTVGGVNNTVSPNTASGSRVVFITHTLLFSGGDYGSNNYRIPAIITAADGSLVTATDKRINSSADLPSNIDIVVRRSIDNGKTWNAPVTIADFGNTGASDPVLVMDRSTGNLICLFATNQGLFGSTPSNPIRIQMCRSTDNGVTWTAPTDLTNQIYGAGCSNPITKNWYAAWIASGRAHQLRDGRIVAAIGVRQTSANQIDNFMIYSDDGGATWQPSTGIVETNGDEAKILDLNDGRLMMSIRNPGVRRMNTSSDKGMTWGTAYNQSDIIDPNCNGDFIRYSSTIDGNARNILLQTIPYASSRKNVSVLYSEDEGLSWSMLKTIYPQSSAYSSATVLTDGSIGIYYECGEYESYQMYFARFTAPQLAGALPVVLSKFSATCSSSGNNVIIQWETSQEINSSYFEIQKSLDGNNWEKVATINAKGNYSLPSNYSYTDMQQNKKLYRLLMVDKEGHKSYSSVSAANCSSNVVKLSLYPNPVKEKFELMVSGFKKNLVVEITNALGQEVSSKSYNLQNINGKIIINCRQLQPGMYYVKMSDGVNRGTASFIKE